MPVMFRFTVVIGLLLAFPGCRQVRERERQLGYSYTNDVACDSGCFATSDPVCAFAGPTCYTPCYSFRNVCESVSVEKYAKSYTGSIKAEEIGIQNIRGTNGPLLLGALEAALGKAGYAVDPSVASSAKSDEVTVTTSSKPITDKYSAVHRVIARIETGSDRITIQVYSQPYRLDDGVPRTVPATEELPHKVYEELVIALQSGNEGS